MALQGVRCRTAVTKTPPETNVDRRPRRRRCHGRNDHRTPGSSSENKSQEVTATARGLVDLGCPTPTGNGVFKQTPRLWLPRFVTAFVNIQENGRGMDFNVKQPYIEDNSDCYLIANHLQLDLPFTKHI